MNPSQLSLFEDWDTTPAKKSITDRFWAFHESNPRTYEHIVRLARQAKARSKRVGMKAIWERLRWWAAFETDGEEPFKLNNSFTAHYARLVMAQEPDLEGVFETREQRAA
jgi:hypothetical protein